MRKILNLLVIIILGFAAWSIFGDSAEAPNVAEETTTEPTAIVAEAPDNATHVLDTTLSEVRWEGVGVGKKHFGTIPLKEGSMNLVGEPQVGNISGSFVFDMNGFDVKDISGGGAESFLKHMKGTDFFDVAQFPEARFEFTKLEPMFSTETTEYTVTGKLTLKDVTEELSFPVTVVHSTGGLKAQASFDLDRTTWNVRYGSGNFFKDLGNKLIEDAVPMTLDLVFKTK